jgi:hypothetical protein
MVLYQSARSCSASKSMLPSASARAGRRAPLNNVSATSDECHARRAVICSLPLSYVSDFSSMSHRFPRAIRYPQLIFVWLGNTS